MIVKKAWSCKTNKPFCEDQAAQEDWQLQQQDFPLQADKLVLSLCGMKKTNGDGLMTSHVDMKDHVTL